MWVIKDISVEGCAEGIVIRNAPPGSVLSNFKVKDCYKRAIDISWTTSGLRAYLALPDSIPDQDVEAATKVAERFPPDEAKTTIMRIQSWANLGNKGLELAEKLVQLYQKL